MTKKQPRVVIVGGGFGGLVAAKALGSAPVEVLLLDRENYHLFQPLLYQVATAGLSPANIAVPIRSVLRRQANLSVFLTEVQGVDLDRRVVVHSSGETPFDYLILATGVRHSYFGKQRWEPLAPGLKSIEDATRIRRDTLLAFEQAEMATDDAERRALMTFVVVGGGPTGVEMAGAIAELARRALARDFRHIDPKSSRVVLVEAGDRVLSSFEPELSDAARHDLEGLGVEVRLNTMVEDVDEAGVVASGERIAARTVVWAAGVQASPAGDWLGAETDRAGRVVVDGHCRPKGTTGVYVIGDTASFTQDGQLLPGVAPVAMQQGSHVARQIEAEIAGRPIPPSFRYTDKGSMATIGRKRAIAQIGRLRFGGFFAWLVWLFVHLMSIVGFKNRVAILFEWIVAYFTFSRGARLITDRLPARK